MNIFNNRYLLKHLLFADNSMGKLYQVRDIKPGRSLAAADVLLHILPGKIFSYPVFKQTCTDLKAIAAPQLSIQVLPVLDCGWTGEEAFFVIQPPDAWAYNSLPPIQNSSATTLHQRAIAVIEELTQANLASNKLCAAFFIVSPEGDLHLLGTALSPTIQQQQDASISLLETEENDQSKNGKTSGRLWGWATITLGIVGIAGATGVYTFIAETAEKNELPETPASKTAIVGTPVEDKPVQVSVVAKPANIKWNGMNEDQLIQRIDSAYQQKRMQTALYFARILWRQGSRHKDLRELLEGITQHYQQQASDGNADQAELSLNQARKLVSEFGLDIQGPDIQAE